jgi:hypothetical protein
VVKLGKVKKKVSGARVTYVSVDANGAVVQGVYDMPRYTTSARAAAKAVKAVTGKDCIVTNIEKYTDVYVMDIEEFKQHATIEND